MHPYVHSSRIHNSQNMEQPKCPSAFKWIKKMWYKHNGLLLSHKKNKIMPFAATWMDLEIIILSEVKDKHHVIIYMWNLKK